MKKLILLLLFIPLVSALSLGTFKTNEDLDIKIPLFDSNLTHLNSATITQLTIIYPNGTQLAANQSMQYNENYFNYSIDSTKVNADGEYQGKLSFHQGAAYGFVDFVFTVNPQGIEQTQERTDTLTRTIYFIGAFAILLSIAGFLTHFAPMKWTLFILSAITLLIALNMISVTLRDEVVNPSIISLIDTFTASTIYFYWFAGGLILMIWMFTVIANIGKAMKMKQIARLEGIT